MPRIYFNTEEPTTPSQGDVRIIKATSTLQVFSGSSWLDLRGQNLTLTAAASVIVPGTTSLSLRNNADSADNVLVVDAGDATIRRGLWASAGFASTNAATPGWYLPGAAGVPTGAVASLGGRVAVYYDTTNNRLAFRNGGSWYATVSLALL